MKVKDMPYEHLTIEEIREELQAVLAEIQNAKCHNCVLRARERMLKLLLRYSSNASLCYIRYSCNTADEYYVKEHEYFDEIGPEVSALLTEIIYCYLAEDMTEGETDPDPDEFLEMVKIPLEDMVDMILSGEIQDAKTQSAVLKVWAMKKKEKGNNV